MEDQYQDNKIGYDELREKSPEEQMQYWDNQRFNAADKSAAAVINSLTGPQFIDACLNLYRSTKNKIQQYFNGDEK